MRQSFIARTQTSDMQLSVSVYLCHWHHGMVCIIGLKYALHAASSTAHSQRAIHALRVNSYTSNSIDPFERNQLQICL